LHLRRALLTLEPTKLGRLNQDRRAPEVDVPYRNSESYSPAARNAPAPSSPQPPVNNFCAVHLFACEQTKFSPPKEASRRAGKTNYMCRASSINGDIRSQPRALGQTNSQWPRVLTTLYKAFDRPKLA
jgi:hypothetical protein